MGLFGAGRGKRLIVRWAPEGVHIPLRCKKCGAVFITTNTGTIESSQIKYGDDYKKCEKCDALGHNHLSLVPDMLSYVKGRWK